VVLCSGGLIEAEDLVLTSLSTMGDTGETKGPSDAFAPCSLSDVERTHILATLNHTSWNKSRTANILGIERSTLDRKIRRYSLADERGAPPPRRRAAKEKSDSAAE
jgi:Nif-specific regulatory protein